MNLTRDHLERAAERGVIAPDQVAPLWSFLADSAADVPSFRFGHILYYVGGLIAIGAMTLFMNLGWERFGGFGLFAISLAYAAAALALVEFFLRRKHLRIPAGIMGAFAVALTPLAIYGLQLALGYWPGGRVYRDFHHWIDWRWLLMELATLAVGAMLLWRYRLAFMVMPIAVTLWYMSMDLAPFLFGGNSVNWETRQAVSLWSGLAMILFAFWVDLRSRSDQDHPFWLYLFGALAFWGGLSMMHSTSELSQFGYLCINLAMIAVGAVLSRRVFVVLGGIGAAGYLWHLASQLFKDSLLFPFALTAIGLAVVWLGVLWQRNEQGVTLRLRALLPTPLRELVERRV